MKYHPTRYYSGLSKTRKLKRYREIQKFGALASDDPRAYVGFKTDIGVKTKTSSYVKTLKARLRTDESLSLQQKAERTGVPYRFLHECYDRGLAAWRTGHRPGATGPQWGHARVASLLVCGKTHYGPDADLVRKAKRVSRRARKWWVSC
jgi:hypothetical protein